MIVEWFEVFNNMVEEYQIIVENIYSMDEMGFPIGIIQNAQVIIYSSIKMKYQAQSGHQEWVTVVEYVYADESSIPLLIIFKGEYLLDSWMLNDAPHDWKFSAMQKGEQTWHMILND